MIPKIELNDGSQIPQLGFGVFQIAPEKTAETGENGTACGLPAHRHRRDVRKRARSRPPV
jgi:hypothetical protein